MGCVLTTHKRDLVEGTVISRPNRFVLTTELDGRTERVYLPDPGELEFLTTGSTVYCSRAENPDRSTDWDAVLARDDDTYVSLIPALANDLFLSAFRGSHIPWLDGYQYVDSEPNYPTRGRGDFLLSPPDRTHDVYLEVKSCTHSVAGVGKFPDRPTKRGQRHLRCLQAISRGENEAHVVFVAQRADIECIEPYRSVDPTFADLLEEAADAGVNIHGISVGCSLTEYRLLNANLPIEI